MARVLINHYRNIAIECARKDKWSVLIIGWAPVRKLKILNKDVDKDWKVFNYNLHHAIDRMMKTDIEDSALQELKLLLGRIGDDKIRVDSRNL